MLLRIPPGTFKKHALTQNAFLLEVLGGKFFVFHFEVKIDMVDRDLIFSGKVLPAAGKECLKNKNTSYLLTMFSND